jgi:hypothetical protein
MRDDLHSYRLPLFLQLFRIFNICLNRVFEEFSLVIFSQVMESLQGSEILCRTARPQTLDILVLISLSKGKSLSLT